MSHMASAQVYPSRPITMVAPYAAGGANGTIGRVMAERMKSSLGQPVIVEDGTGAGGTIAVGRVARAAPDGYTLSLGTNGSHVVAGATYALQYDLLKDFEPVALLSAGPFVFVANKTMPANDLKGLIAWLKANPDRASVGTGGIRVTGRPRRRSAPFKGPRSRNGGRSSRPPASKRSEVDPLNGEVPYGGSVSR
jgi:tripartite-type tricarboxylate transporter receptor subunit TctC